MGKRSRRRGGVPTALPPEAPAKQTRAKVTKPTEKDGPPPPPWAPLPLTEISVALGLALLVVGFLTGGEAGMAILIVGLVLGSLAGFEQAFREHRSGYKSHAAVLAALPAAITVGLLAWLGVDRNLVPFIAIAVGIGCWLPIRAEWLRRTGGSGN